MQLFAKGDQAPFIIQAPMAGAQGFEMAASVANAGGLGSIPCAMLSPEQISEQVANFREAAPGKPINLNFFAHTPQHPDEESQARWRKLLEPYYVEMGLDPNATSQAPNRAPFGETQCQLVEELRPEVVSFHFGLPSAELVSRVKSIGAKVISSATTLEEGIWLEKNGADAVIAQGREAGGHRAMFIESDPARQMGTLFLLPTLVNELTVPIIAAGGISSREILRAAFAMGASAVQIGTAFLFSSEAKISDLHYGALTDSANHTTAITNLFSGKPARGIVNRIMQELGAINSNAPVFPTAGAALAPLKKAAEEKGKADFSSLWSGEGAALTVRMIEGLDHPKGEQHHYKPTAGQITKAFADALG